MDKFRKIRNIFGNLVFVLAVLFLPAAALAENKIDVEYPVGTNIDGNDIFDEDNILPGWEDSKTIRVKNESTTDDTDFYIKFVLQGNEKLAKALKLYVIRVSDGSYRIGGAGDRYTLKKADGERLYVDKLSKKESEKYRIKIKFNEDAGNEYQGRTAKFKIKFTIESEESGAGTEEEILAAEGRTGFTGSGGVIGPGGEVEGVKGEQTEVAGAGTACSEWPLWVWILILAIYASVFNCASFYNYKEQKDFRWFWEAALTAGGLLLWVYYDKCDWYPWFPYAGAVLGGISYGYYYYMLKKLLSAGIGQIKTG